MIPKIHYQGDQPELSKLGPEISILAAPGDLVKSASASLSRTFPDLSKYAPDKDHFLMHLVAMGSMEKYANNRNADAWPLKGLLDYHHTFVTKGHLFREHRNTSPELAIGSVKAAAMHPELDRVELLVWGNIKKAEEEFEMAKSGSDLSYSMSARVPYDICSCCHNKARNRREYCDHLLSSPNQYLPEFQKYAFAINDKPTFFDISRVKYPADRIAYYLQYRFPDEELRKAASAEGVILGADWGDFEGIKAAAGDTPLPGAYQAICLNLAEEEAWLNGINEAGTSDKAMFAKNAARQALPGELDDADIERMRKMQPGELFDGLAKRAVLLPAATFFSYLTGKPIAEAQADADAARAYLPDVYAKMASCGTCVEDAEAFTPCDGDAADDDEVQRFMDGVESKFGCKAEPVRDRVMRMSITVVRFTSGGMPKSASSARALAEMYALYKLAAIHAAPESYGAPQRLLAVLQNRAKHD